MMKGKKNELFQALKESGFFGAVFTMIFGIVILVYILM